MLHTVAAHSHTHRVPHVYIYIYLHTPLCTHTHIHKHTYTGSIYYFFAFFTIAAAADTANMTNNKHADEVAAAATAAAVAVCRPECERESVMTPRQIQRRRFLRAHLSRFSVSETTLQIPKAFYVDRHEIQKEIFSPNRWRKNSMYTTCEIGCNCRCYMYISYIQFKQIQRTHAYDRAHISIHRIK